MEPQVVTTGASHFLFLNRGLSKSCTWIFLLSIAADCQDLSTAILALQRTTIFVTHSTWLTSLHPGAHQLAPHARRLS